MTATPGSGEAAGSDHVPEPPGMKFTHKPSMETIQLAAAKQQPVAGNDGTSGQGRAGRATLAMGGSQLDAAGGADQRFEAPRVVDVAVIGAGSSIDKSLDSQLSEPAQAQERTQDLISNSRDLKFVEATQLHSSRDLYNSNSKDRDREIHEIMSIVRAQQAAGAHARQDRCTCSIMSRMKAETLRQGGPSKVPRSRRGSWMRLSRKSRSQRAPRR